MSIVSDRTKETTTTTGTGDVTLDGTSTGFQTINAGIGTNKFFPYQINHDTLDEWEVGEGYLSASNVLVRNKVTESSNADALVNFSAGTKDVFVTISADQFKGKGTAYALALGYGLM